MLSEYNRNIIVEKGMKRNQAKEELLATIKTVEVVSEESMEIPKKRFFLETKLIAFFSLAIPYHFTF